MAKNRATKQHRPLRFLGFALCVLAFNPGMAQSELKHGSSIRGRDRILGTIERPEVLTGCLISAASRLTMASVFGSCQAAGSVQPPTAKMTNDNICEAPGKMTSVPLKGIALAAKSDNRSCAPSAVPNYSQKQPRLTTKNGKLNPAPSSSTDCSGLVSSILQASGMRLRPNQDNGVTTTAEMIGFGGANDCFEVVKFTSETGLMPGDVLVARSGGVGHTVVIDRVGDDPFGLKKNGDACKFENFDDWDFTITESTGKKVDGYKIGPSTWPANENFKRGANYMRRAFLHMKKAACKSAEAKVDNGGSQMKLFRHKGKKDPRCVNPNPPTLHNEKCLNGCRDEFESWKSDFQNL